MKESTHAIKDVGGDGEGHKNKLWDLFGKAKEGFRGSKGEYRKDDGLVVRVHELCTWVQRGEACQVMEAVAGSRNPSASIDLRGETDANDPRSIQRNQRERDLHQPTHNQITTKIQKHN